MIQVPKKRLCQVGLIALGVCLVALALVRLAVHLSVRDRVYASVRQVPPSDIAIVLGTRALRNGKPSERLANRCNKAIELYRVGKAKKILMSGDNRTFSNCECVCMRRYAVENGVPAKDILIDPLGRRTYDTMYRARNVFHIKRATIVTQGFHMERSLYYAKAIGIDAYGVTSDLAPDMRDRVREPFAVLLAVMDVYLLQHPGK